MLQLGVLLVGVRLRVLVGLVLRNTCRDLLGDNLADLVLVLPLDVAEEVVEGLDDRGESVDVGFALAATATRRHWLDGCVGIVHRHLQRCFGLNPVAVHVDGLQHPLGEVFFLGRGQLRDEEVQEDRQLLPHRVTVTQDRGEETVAAHKGLRLPLELDLIVLAELVGVLDHARIKDRIEFVPVCAAQVKRHQVFHLLPAIHLLPV